MPRWLRENWLQVAILVTPFIVVGVFWGRFPDRVVVQWRLDGQPNKWAGKTFGLLVGPLLSIAVAIFFGWMPRFDPKLRRNPDWNGRSLRIIRIATTLLISFISVLIAAEALGYHFNSPALGTNAVLLLFLVLGNYLGTFPPSYFAGIRTPWTLRNDDVWRDTHRNAGRVMVIGTLVFFGLQFVVSRELLMGCFVAFIAASLVWSTIYSYLRARSVTSRSNFPPDVPCT
jgi:uncharacterized membrane protein